MEKVLKPRYTKNVNTPMTVVQYEALQQVAIDNDVNVTDVVRTAVAMFIETHGCK